LQQEQALDDLKKLKVTFSATKGLIYSETGKEISADEEVSFEIAGLVDHLTTKSVNVVGTLLLSLAGLALLICFVLALFQGSLVASWMMINTLQLIAHVPLLSPKLPANAHYFLLNLLSVVRLEFESFNASVDDLAARMQEYGLLSDESYFFSASLHNMGYRFDIARNLLLLASGAALIAFVWLMVAVGEKLRSCCSKKEAARPMQAEVSLNNVMVRFLLEAYFEVMLCAFITLSSPSAAGTAKWLVSLLCVLAGFAAMGVLTSLFFRNGPYVEDSYAQGFSLHSLWGRRSLSPTLVRTVQDEKPASARKLQAPVVIVEKANEMSLNTLSIQNSDVPLNQLMGAAIEFDQPHQHFEGGEETLEVQMTTDRGEMTTHRDLVTREDVSVRSTTLAEKMRGEARLKLSLEDQVRLNKRYATVFDGLKLNTEHNSAVVEPLLFLLRRTIFATVIVFLPNAPLVAAMIMLVASVCVLAFTIVEQPWKDPAHNMMAIINEVFVHGFLVVVLACASIEHLDSQSNSWLGWAIIALICLVVHTNLLFMIAKAYAHVKLLQERRSNRKKARAHRMTKALQANKVSDENASHAPQAISVILEVEEA